MDQYWIKLTLTIAVSTVMVLYPINAAFGLQAIIYHLKEFVLDPIARLIGRSLMSKIQEIILLRVRDLGREDGSLIRDWRSFQQQGQRRGENLFRNILANAQICDYLKEPVYKIFGIPPGAEDTLGDPGTNRIYSTQSFNLRNLCKTSLSSEDIALFKSDMTQGGWEVWEELIKPENNIYGVVSDGIKELRNQRIFAEGTDVSEGASNQGFVSNRKSGDGGSCLLQGVGGCAVYANIKSSGSNIKEAVGAIVKGESIWLTNTDELAEAIWAAFFSISGILTDITGGFLDPDVGIGADTPPEGLNEKAQEQCVEECVAAKCSNVEPLQICELICTDEERTKDPVTGEETVICRRFEKTCELDPDDTSVQDCRNTAEFECQKQCPVQKDFPRDQF